MGQRKQKAQVDRRSGVDRRVMDKGPPPGKAERRRSVEPRKPDVVEIEMSNSQWSALTRGSDSPRDQSDGS